ncbi:MAG: serine hydrolase [Phormidesmis sp.]
MNPSLQTQLESILESVWNTFPNLAQNQIALTWIAYEPPYRVNTGGGLSAEAFWAYQPQGASYRGVELIAPGSIAHLFYLVALNVWLEQGMVQPTAELSRAMADMMAGTNHDAASYVMDVLSGTTSGPSLPPGPDETWASQRNIVNRYFTSLGWPELRSINLNQKTWCDRPYGRERDFLGKTLENRNQLTTEATVRLLHSIIGGVSVSSARSQSMMALMKRQSLTHAFPMSAEVWEMASVSTTGTHHIAYVESEGSIHPFLLAIFTVPSRGADNRLSGELSDELKQQNEQITSWLAQQIFEASQQNFLADIAK